MTGKDTKYLLAYVGPALAFVSVSSTGWMCWLAVIYAFVTLPLLEWMIDKVSHPNFEAITSANDLERGKHLWFDILLYLNVPLIYALVFYYLGMVTNFQLSFLEIGGMTVGVGIFLGANGINVAHELGHRRKKWERVLSILLLIPAWYQHFYIEHNQGHHRYVGTAKDPATARYGETFYAFWLRSTVGSFVSAWALEVARLEKHTLPVFGVYNQMLQFVILQLIYIMIVFWWAGIAGLFYALLIGVVAFTLLEAINYIEHYGLTRKRLASGRYEKVDVQHSWNSHHKLGRIMLYELSLHADHHYKASKKYQSLLPVNESPQLPTGYPGSILLALIPPLWFLLIDKRIPDEMIEVSRS